MRNVEIEFRGTLDVLLGLQWGDEGKGKVVDVLAAQYPAVARFQGGPNAGHSLVFNDQRHVLHTIPSGVFRPDTYNLIGSGVVFCPITFMDEAREIESVGVDLKICLHFSRRAHLILPTHRLLDAANERALASRRIGSTGKGIGPCYTDKAARYGLRIGDIEQPDFLQKYAALKERHLAKLDNYDESLLKQLETKWMQGIELLRGFDLVDSEYEAERLLAEGRSILAEGAQGTMLDVDFGTYPFVTSSSTVCAGACIGLGIAPNHVVGHVYGITKAYCTRVGEGPFPTELNDATGNKLRELGHEFGATTGRSRRCGWLDMVALKYAVMVNGVSDIVLTKADVMANFPVVKVAVAYEINGKRTDHVPYDFSGPITPIYKEFPGWDSSVVHARSYKELPDELKRYIEFIEETTGVWVSIISVGPDREQTIVRQQFEEDDE